MLFGRRFDVDFVHEPRVPAGAIALLALGIVAAIGAGAWCEREWAAGRALAAERAEVDARLERERDRAGSRRDAVPVDPQAAAQARDVLAELHRPWRALFQQLEADRAGAVHLEQFAVDGRFESLQVQAEAKTLGDVLQFVQALPGTGPVVAVQLANHELRETPAGRVVSARIAARIDAAAVR